MDKVEGAFLTIGELSQELGVPQHVLRYWESRFPQLRPLQRAGNRRYYRPQDVAIARAIHTLLNVEGFTMKGAAKALAEGGANGHRIAKKSTAIDPVGVDDVLPAQAVPDSRLIDRLRAIRAVLADAIGLDRSTGDG